MLSSSNIHPSLCLSEIITVNSVTGDGCMVLLFQRSFIGSLHYSTQHPSGTSEWPETAFCLLPSKVARLQEFVLQDVTCYMKSDHDQPPRAQTAQPSRRQTNEGSQHMLEDTCTHRQLGSSFAVIGAADDPEFSSHTHGTNVKQQKNHPQSSWILI